MVMTMKLKSSFHRHFYSDLIIDKLLMIHYDYTINTLL